MTKPILISVTVTAILGITLFLTSTSVPAQPVPRLEQGELSRQQARFPRVREARSLKESVLRELFRNAGVSYPSNRLLIRAFKLDKEVELWAAGSKTYTLIETYPICCISGNPGPKRQRGDLQVPEGFYRITGVDFNPVSMFHLSMRINYPNHSDRIKGHPTRPGGDIFIHGDCVSIGCIAITDDRIKELYIAAVDSIASGAENVPVHIFPCRFDRDSCREELQALSSADPGLAEFWSNLEEGYAIFNETSTLPNVTVDKKGSYHFSSENDCDRQPEETRK
jgi:murein L,D-transpeptidase YafK